MIVVVVIISYSQISIELFNEFVTFNNNCIKLKSLIIYN